VNSLTLTHYQGTDLRYLFIADFCYWLIHESLILPHFQPQEWGLAYKQDSLYASIYGSHILCFGFIQYVNFNLYPSAQNCTAG